MFDLPTLGFLLSFPRSIEIEKGFDQSTDWFDQSTYWFGSIKCKSF